MYILVADHKSTGQISAFRGRYRIGRISALRDPVASSRACFTTARRLRPVSGSARAARIGNTADIFSASRRAIGEDSCRYGRSSMAATGHKKSPHTRAFPARLVLY
jgi:hypothetical protein